MFIFRASVSVPLFLLIGALSGCGGGGGSAGVLSGSVIDGYIEGATVCLDTNSNGVCDSGEPSAKTDSSGAYVLNTNGVSTTGLNLIVDIPVTAKDSDDDGKTLAEAGKSAYTMAATADQPSVITPLTTLVVNKVRSESLTVEQAKVKVLNELGLPSDTNFHEDHVKSGNTQVQSVARQVAGVLQQAQASLPANTSPEQRLSGIVAKLKGQVDGLGSLASETAADLQKVPTSIASVASEKKLMLYKMRSTKTGELITASAMVFTPKGTGPRPMIVFGHGTTGVSKVCAPSVLMQTYQHYEYEALIAQLLQAGIAVVAPDYEGRGPASDIPDAHPYLHAGSAGNSMALAAVAAMKLFPDMLSGAWMTLGHSQGGHAAIAGARYANLANQINNKLNFKGAVAIAPASNLSYAVTEFRKRIEASSLSPSDYKAGYGYVGDSNGYISYLVLGSKYTHNALRAEQVFGTRMSAVHQAASAQCIDGYATAIKNDINAYAQVATATPSGYTGYKVEQLTTAAAKHVLDSAEIGLVNVPGKTLIIQGQSDAIVLPEMTRKLKDLMLAKKSDVTLKEYSDTTATHSGVLDLTAAKEALLTHITSLLGSMATAASAN